MIQLNLCSVLFQGNDLNSFQKKKINARGEIDSTILIAYNYRMRHAYARTTARANQPTTPLREMRARVSSPKPCHGHVVSLSNARNSYRVRRFSHERL